MSDLAETVANAADEELCQEGNVNYVSRQPILDRRGAVFGYELKFQAVSDETTGGLPSSSRGMLDALTLFGMDRFTSGAWGFVDCDAGVLTEGMFEGLAPALTVLDVPRCSPVPGKLFSACCRLKDSGFRIALAGFEPDDGRASLLPLADYVKVEAATIDSSGWNRLCRELSGSGVLVIAEHIHDQESYRTARDAGLQYFQGFHLCHPVTISNGTLPADHLHRMEVLRELFKDPLDLRALSPLVRGDPSLVYRVLRYANSPLCAVRAPVTSIESAIMIMGDTLFRRIATVAIQSTLTQGHSPELLRMALVRARFCARTAPLCRLDPEEMYLTGMLSMLPAMLRVPMRTILPGLPLRMEIREALAGIDVKERCLVGWVEDLERGNIGACETAAEKYGLDRRALAEAYLQVLQEVATENELDSTQ